MEITIENIEKIIRENIEVKVDHNAGWGPDYYISGFKQAAEKIFELIKMLPIN